MTPFRPLRKYAEDPDQYGDTIFLAAGAMLGAPFIMGLCNHVSGLFLAEIP